MSAPADRYLSTEASWRAMFECSRGNFCQCFDEVERYVEVEPSIGSAHTHEGAADGGELKEYVLNCQRRFRVIRAPRGSGSLIDPPAKQPRLARLQVMGPTGDLELDAPLFDENSNFLCFENGHWVPLFGEREAA